MSIHIKFKWMPFSKTKDVKAGNIMVTAWWWFRTGSLCTT